LEPSAGQEPSPGIDAFTGQVERVLGTLGAAGLGPTDLGMATARPDRDVGDARRDRVGSRPRVVLDGLRQAICKAQIGVSHHSCHHGSLIQAGALVILPEPVGQLPATLEKSLHDSPYILIAVLALGDIIGALDLLETVLDILPFLLPGSVRAVTDADGGRGDHYLSCGGMGEDCGISSRAPALRARVADRDVIQPGAAVVAVHHRERSVRALPRGGPGWHPREAASTNTLHLRKAHTR
jgi:hypothetical protein